MMKSTGFGSQNLPQSMLFLGDSTVRLIIFLVVLALMAYVFEFTKVGRYSKAIGENEIVAKNVGIPVTLIKIRAFSISGILAGLGGVFTVAQLAHQPDDVACLEILQPQCGFPPVFLLPAERGKIYKWVLGSISISSSLTVLHYRQAESHISQTVEGVILLLILFITIVVNNGGFKRFFAARKKTDKTRLAESNDNKAIGL
jgi:ribose transport system permease protein